MDIGHVLICCYVPRNQIKLKRWAQRPRQHFLEVEIPNSNTLPSNHCIQGARGSLALADPSVREDQNSRNESLSATSPVERDYGTVVKELPH